MPAPTNLSDLVAHINALEARIRALEVQANAWAKWADEVRAKLSRG